MTAQVPSGRSGSGSRILLRYYELVAALVFCIVLLVSLTLLSWLNESRIRESETRNADVNLIFAEHIERVFRSIYWMTDAAGKAYMQHGADRSLLRTELERINSVEPYSLQLSIVDLSGIFVLSNGSEQGGADLRDRDHIKVHLEGSKPDIYVSRPLVGRVSGKPSINITRRYVSADGKPIAIVVVSYDPLMINEFFLRHDFDGDVVMSLFHSEGILLARSGQLHTAIGTDLSESPIFKDNVTRGIGKGYAVLTSRLDGVERFYNFQKLPNLPLVVVTGVGTKTSVKAMEPLWWLAGGWTALLGSILVGGRIGLGKYLQKQEEVQAERMRNQEAEHVASLLHSAFQSTGVFLLLIDGQDKPVFFNKPFEDLRETTPDLKLDKLLSRSKGTFKEDEPARNLTQRIELPDGRKRVVFWTIARADWASPDARVAIGIDRTEIEAAEQAVYQKARLATLGEMATGLAHELAQPLTVVGFAASMIAKKAEGSADEMLDLLTAATARVSQTVDRMKIFGRRSDLVNRSHFNPEECAESVVLLTGNALRLAGVELTVQPCTEPVVAAGDPILFEQVLLNLVLNARDALIGMSPGDRTKKIEIAYGYKDADRVVVRVSDNGPGMSEAVASRIFEPFFTTKAGGSGLGLALCYGIISEMAGTISVVSNSSGTTFELIVPAAGRSE